ncbi:MAG TPA: PAS domain-containing protein, partial [Solirubrobacteraceae bacterium]|nr:PAS domain-containing protein [Solirubrobacteraceae bacterium]
MSPLHPVRGRPDQRAGPNSAVELPVGVEVEGLLDRIPAILYISDTGSDGRWHYVSRGIETILGFSAQEWLENPHLWAHQLDPRDRARVLAREDALAEPAVPEEYRMVHRRGHTVWVRDEAALVTDARGRARWHGVISDITDLKVAAQELRLRAHEQAAVATLGTHALEGAPLARLIDEALESVVAIDSVAGAAVLALRAPEGTLEVRAHAGAWPASELERLASSGAATGDAARGRAPRVRSRGLLAFPIETTRGAWGELLLRKADGAPLAATDVDFSQTVALVLSSSIARRAAEDRVR